MIIRQCRGNFEMNSRRMKGKYINNITYNISILFILYKNTLSNSININGRVT